MQIKTFLSALALALSFSATGAHAQAQTTPSAEAITEQVQLQQIRNATLKITYADTTFLIDRMLSKKGSYPGFEGTYRSQLRNPLVDLPMSINDILAGVAAVIDRKRTRLNSSH